MNLVRVEEIVKKEDYVKNLKDNLRQFVFQHDNDSKHTSLLVKNYFQMSKVNILNWHCKKPRLESNRKTVGLTEDQSPSQETNKSGGA